MNKEMRQKTKNSINLCKVKLENLKPRIETSNEANIVYNRILIEKAVLEQSLKTNPFSFILKVKKFFSFKKEKNICDYFKQG
ncbi:MAG: hypothetical protein K6C94_03825 [Candidatus Gastranaerophilales bacterium]|nr:hypothetical protein [Candidatus Gastranaerophilales bacterium]